MLSIKNCGLIALVASLSLSVTSGQDGEGGQGDAPPAGDSPSCNGQGFGETAPDAGEYCTTVIGITPAACEAGKIFIQGLIGLDPPECPECPAGQEGCAPGNYTTGGNVSWVCTPNNETGKTRVCGTVPAGMKSYKVCGLCAVKKPL